MSDTEDFIALDPIVENHKKPWSEEDKQKLFELRMYKGISYVEAAILFGRTPLSIYNIIKKQAVNQVIENQKDIIDVCAMLNVREAKLHSAVERKLKILEKEQKLVLKKESKRKAKNKAKLLNYINNKLKLISDPML